MPTKILLVDDHPLVRKGLRLLIEGEADMQVVGEAGNGREAIDRVGACSPDVVIMDITMPDINGIEATRKIVADFPHVKVIALSIHAERRFVQEMLQAGAAGYILKDSVPEEIIGSIRTVMRDKVYLSVSITGIVVSEYVKGLSKATESGEDPAQEIDDWTLLRTKLHRTQLTRDLIPRTNLVNKIDALRRRPFTLVSAAAGYGKSTLASLWLKAWNGPYGWVSLDEDENDLRIFMHYLLAAIRSSRGAGFSKVCNNTQSLLQAPHLPPLAALCRHFLNDLDEIETPFILVLDDYHKISDPQVHELMSELLIHPTRNLHLILLTRRDPPLPIGKLRGRGQINEIGMSQLRFTLEETALFLKQNLGLSVDETTAAAIHERLEGWAAGMCLVSRSFGNRKDVKHFLAGLEGNFSSISEYLMVEVLTQQSAAMARLMVESALFNRFCASLCDALDGATAEPGKGGLDGAAFIAKLQKDNLFLIALDTENRWFRYHHMFQQLLKKLLKRQMGPEEIARVYSRAGAWFAEKGLIEEAIKYALEGGGDLAAAQIVERNRLAALDADRWYVLRTWLDKLPHEIKQKRPHLLLGQAWVLLETARIGDILPIIERTEFLLAKDLKEPALWSEINFFRGLVCYFKGEGARSVAFFNKATELLSETAFLLLRSEVRYWICLALHLDGHKKTALQKLYDGIRNKDFQEGMPLSRLSFGLCFLYMLEGDFWKASREAIRLSQVGGSNRLVNAETWSMYVQGNAAFQMFDLDAAHHHFDLILENQYITNSRAVVDAMAGLSITRQFMGKPDEADETMNLAQRFAQWTKDPLNFEIVRSCQARLALLRNDLDFASRWQMSLKASPGTLLMLFFLEIPHITECRVLIAMGSDAGLKAALERLEALRQKSNAWQSTCQTIDILVLQSMALVKQGRPDEAVTVLEGAVALAEPGECIRPFVELGPPMADLLKRLQKQNVAVDFIEKLLAAFADGELDAMPEVAAHLSLPDKPPVRLSAPEQPLVEPLTNRELDVLALLGQRLQNKEIAEKLFVSNQTVKSHLKNIYQKLNVSSRRKAVTQAHRLGIIRRR